MSAAQDHGPGAVPESRLCCVRGIEGGCERCRVRDRVSGRTSSAASVDPVRRFLAARAGVDPDTIDTYSFVASESHEWSEYTIEDFSCSVKFTISGEEKVDWWGESEVVEFLNMLVPVAA